MTSVFALSGRSATKAQPRLIARDEQQLGAVAATLDAQIATTRGRLAAVLRLPAGSGTRAVERDQQVRHLRGRLRLLERFGLDLCLGRMVPADGAEPIYVGRIGLTGDDGERLVVDWRSDAARPFFAATGADPMGLASRRRYRWTDGVITDFWDEVFTPEARDVVLDDDSALLAGLAASRTSRMRDVLATIQADQDEIIRADSRGTRVVDGGPGTGKTVVALHRAAYLLHTDARLGEGRGGVLVVGPHRPYLAYVADVLPGLGEEGVRTCTVLDLVPEGDTAPPETDPAAAALKSSRVLVDAIEPAVGLYEEPPKTSHDVETPWGTVRIGARDWAEVFTAPGSAVPHNEAHDLLWEAMAEIVAARLDREDVSPDILVPVLRAEPDLAGALRGAWIVVEPEDLLADLWTVPAYLRRCAPTLGLDEVQRLQRDDGTAWTRADLPLLDAARHRLGDTKASARERRRSAARAVERRRMDDVVEDLIAADDGDLMLMSMLRGEDLRNSLDDDSANAESTSGWAGPFAHVVVDEAQELTDAEWAMLVRRCPSRSFTVVGDRAQARRGFEGTWQERLARAGLDRIEVSTLTINYRTPEEVLAEAAPQILAVLPDANVPTSVRSSGHPVVHAAIDELESVLEAWLADHDEGVACVIGHDLSRSPSDRVTTLTPAESKGLEFDFVVVVDPRGWGDSVTGAVDRYVAMTRATSRLTVLTGTPAGRSRTPRAAPSAPSGPLP